MKRIHLTLLLLLAALGLQARIIKLDTGGSSLWNQSNARFAAWHWGGTNQGAWSAFMQGDGDVFSAEISDESNYILFIRFADTTKSPDWNATIWNRTCDLSIPADADTYTITGWGESEGSWNGRDFVGCVPSQCGDVMLQAFYWDSNLSGMPYGQTRWTSLRSQAADLANSFDLIWLPPSAHSTGGVGYIPLEYHNQSSDWGTQDELKNLIRYLHTRDVKVVADIVINHLGNKDGWSTFYTQNFGRYGSFTPDASWICRDDELNYDDAAGRDKGLATGPYDDGYGDGKNFGGARDLAHDKAEVREMCRAYLKWLREVIGYDGFRYDFCRGFHGSHFNDYNKFSTPDFSVLEYWDALDPIRNVLKDASWNTLAFDFPTKFAVFNGGINDNNFVPCRGSGMLGAGLGKYAVTFIDNHDTFREDWNRAFSPDDPWYETKVLQAHAYLLSMPGVPCVAYPHWYQFKDKIRPMIQARKAAGVHSESFVTDISGTDAGGSYYDATITGTKGTIILRLGTHAAHPAPEGYRTACTGNGYAVYYTSDEDTVVDSIQQDATNVAPVKYLHEGRLYIRSSAGVYDAVGRRVE